ncbi:MAG TPA: protein kinase [Steroidobacteraceae bacterium]|jgi:serine/threonine protein kinase
MLAMQLDAEGEITQPTAAGNTRSFEEWLDELAAGECGWETVFRGVADSLTTNADAGWELLALVDQYYRRHRISAEDFHGLNTHVQALLLGSARPVQVEPPLKSPPPAPRAVPALAPAPQAAPVAPVAPVVQPKVTSPSQPPQPRMLVVNEVLRNRYRIRGILGHGGMGTVYAAIDEFRLDHGDGGQRVAIKALHTEVVQRPQLLAELRSEFQRLQSLSHPNIVRVHEFDRDGDLTFFTMEQLSGAPLSRVLANHNYAPLYRPHALAIIRQAGGAVAYAHSRGVVHGDLNPGNIFITDQGEIRVLDFGASYRLRREPTIPDLDDLARPAVATPSFASCEVLQGGPANVRDDIYAMACVSYALLTGKHPFQGQNALQARAARLSPRRPAGLNHRQWNALRAGLQFQRKHRPADMQVWLDQLQLPSQTAQLPPLPTIMGSRAQRSSVVGWATGGVIAVVAALCWWALENPDQLAHATAGLSASATGLWNNIRAAGGAPSSTPSPATVGSNTPATTPPAPPPTPSPPLPRRTAPVVAPAAIQSQAATANLPRVAAAAAAAQAPVVARPSSARIELAADVVDVQPMQPVAGVVVRRRESYRNDVSFNWWTESGTAKPGQDFVPVKSRTEFIPSGARETRLLVPIVADPRRHVAKSFYVVIDDPSDGARLGSRTITQVTIPPSY